MGRHKRTCECGKCSGIFRANDLKCTEPDCRKFISQDYPCVSCEDKRMKKVHDHIEKRFDLSVGLLGALVVGGLLRLRR